MSSLAYNYRPPPNPCQESGLYNVEQETRSIHPPPHDLVTDTYPARTVSASARPPTRLSRPSSPARSHHSFTSTASSQPRNPSQASLIAPSLQIPRTVNDSQGSLSELAAQVTCLFWFESAATLEMAEDAASAALPLPALKRETRPSPGFRKWVTTIISTTQVAQNVIILALLFIYRLKRQNPSVQGKEGSEYRLLTVALMLGNKFLDDNTYTNKTWADVSGISVGEVHIMEVEFLSNMKYNLFTSAEQWDQWQTKLGRFARFLDRACQPAAPAVPQPLPAYNQISLPSPPTSFQASPPRGTTPAAARVVYAQPQQPPSTYLPTPYQAPIPPMVIGNPRKRSVDDDAAASAQPSKRLMYSQPSHQPARQYGQPPPPPPPPSTTMGRSSDGQHRQGPPTTTHDGFPNVLQPARDNLGPRLPPLDQHIKLSTHVPPMAWSGLPAGLGQQGSAGAMAAALQPARSSRNHSPHISSTNVSPTNTAPFPANTHSPSFFLRQRDSPYKPVRGVQTLLVPPPSRAMHQPEHVDHNQMHYQPLGRPQERQEGRLPYISQNQWHEQQHKVPTPVDSWQSFMAHERPPHPNQPQNQHQYQHQHRHQQHMQMSQVPHHMH